MSTDRSWSYTMLNFYMRYAWASQFVDFGSIDSIANRLRVLASRPRCWPNLHPDLTLFLFDIPPQLYVAHQYLKAVFPDRVVPYGTISAWRVAPSICCHLGTFPRLRELRPSLFWNAASFQEMEPHVVRNYLETVDEAAPDHIYLMERMEGMPTGVAKATVLHDYKDALPNYSLVRLDPSLLANGRNERGYSDSHWHRA